MEATFHYINIFSTKGVEYLLVITFMASFVLFLQAVRQPATASEHMQLTSALHETQGAHSAPIIMDNPFAIPQGLFVAPGHAAARLELDGSLALGSGPLPNYLLGDIDRIELSDKKQIKAGEVMAVLHSGDKALQLRAPPTARSRPVTKPRAKTPACSPTPACARVGCCA